MSIVSDRLVLSGHQSFPLRYSWLPKMAAAVSADSLLFRREDAMVGLGVGKNMVDAIQYWSTAMELLPRL